MTIVAIVICLAVAQCCNFSLSVVYCGHLGDLAKRPVSRGVLVSGVNVYYESILRT